MRSKRLVAIVAIAIVAILALTYVTRDGDDGPIVILHSNDTHCHYDDGLGLSTLKALKDSMESKGDAVFVVDAGDFLQGGTFGTITQGRSSVDVMNSVGYDVGIPGNHEFDFGFPVLLERASSLNYPLICANLVYPDGKSVFPEYVVLEKNGVEVGFFGLLTPDTAINVKAGKMGDAIVTDPVEAASRMVTLLRDAQVDEAVRKVKEECTAVLETSIATSEVFLDGERNDVRTKETNMGDLVADAIR